MLYCKIEGKVQLQLTSKELCKIHIIWILDSFQQCPLVTVGVNAWQHTCWYLSSNHLQVSNFLASNCDCVKKIQISGMPGSPLFPCLPEIELLDQVFLDFGSSQGGRWPSSYQTIIYECHSVPHKTALWCVRYSARYQLWDLREGFWKKPDQRQNADHQHKICNLRKKNGSPTCATCFPTSSFWCMFTSFPSHSRFWELCPYTLKLSAPCICWNVLGY